MKRYAFPSLLLFGIVLILSGFSYGEPPRQEYLPVLDPDGPIAGGEPSADLQQYQRLPLSIRLIRLNRAGISLYNRRRYEDAVRVFEAMFILDPQNLGAKFWISKCKEMLDRERSEWVKAELYRKRGSLVIKESKYDNWVWGPTVGHFEVRYAEPKPYVPPVRKRHPKATDDQLAKAKEGAAGGDPDPLFELAMSHWSRGEKEPAIDALESALEKDPEIAGRDDEGLLAAVADELATGIAGGKATPEQFLLAGRVAHLQGDLPGMLQHLVRAVSSDPKLETTARPLLEKFVHSGQTTFLMKIPEIYSFRQAYAYEESEDRLYLKATFAPSTPFPMVPIDLMFDWTAIKGIDLIASDVLFTFIDPSMQGTTRLWLVPKFKDKPFPTFLAKLRIRIDPDLLPYLDLSNVNVSPDLPDNWSVVVGPNASFGEGFPTPEFEDAEDSMKIKAFQLGKTNGRGPSLTLRDFHVPLPKPLDVWKAMDKVGSGI